MLEDTNRCVKKTIKQRSILQKDHSVTVGLKRIFYFAHMYILVLNKNIIYGLCMKDTTQRDKEHREREREREKERN